MSILILQLIKGAVTVLAGIGFIWLAKTIDDRRTRDFDDDRHIDDGNVAVGLRRGGLYLAMAIAFTGSLDGGHGGFFADLLQFILDGIIILLFLFAARFINDAVMMGHVDNDAECIRTFEGPNGETTTGNTALGVVEAGMFLATGFILKGSLSGSGGTLIQSLGSTILFFGLGQACLLLFGLIYEKTTDFNVRQEIKGNNIAAGIGLAGTLTALGIILMASISGPFTGWGTDIAAFLVYAVYGMVMLLVFRALIDRLILPTTNVATEVKQDRNAAALIVVECALAAVALLIASAA